MTVISKSQLARELGVSAPRISQLVREGLPVRGDGRIDRVVALAWVRRNGSLRLYRAAGGPPISLEDIEKIFGLLG